MPGDALSVRRVLQVTAYVAIVAWGIRETSHMLSIILFSLLWAYAVLPSRGGSCAGFSTGRVLPHVNGESQFRNAESAAGW